MNLLQELSLTLMVDGYFLKIMSQPNVNINGIAHIALSVKDLKISKKFYSQILPYFGMSLVHESDKSFYYIGARTGILIQKIEGLVNTSFSQNTIGLHHFCFRAKSENDIDLVHKILLNMRANIVRGPLYGNWVKGYYYILFEDPDKIRLEVNYVPKKGVFERNTNFDPSGDY